MVFGGVEETETKDGSEVIIVGAPKVCQLCFEAGHYASTFQYFGMHCPRVYCCGFLKVVFGRVKNGGDRHFLDDYGNNEDCGQNHTALCEADIRELQEQDVTELLSVLNITKTSATILLCQYNWDVDSVNNDRVWRMKRRRVLKWTYAYGYYLPEDEPAKRQFFEYLQGEAEFCLEHLHECAENGLKRFLDAKEPEDYQEFRTKLTDLARVTKHYFANLVRLIGEWNDLG
ncbi:hypothetical protein IFM89_000300 [Coptis chinensis]|uniref:Uncharacterized protein n=1 Tax=Coptis chinensis TaxID=261450 RepID=A0A835HBU5_9MAGN|nr:hypothetical protein IFM89_000300 [Coptis chinensis]